MKGATESSARLCGRKTSDRALSHQISFHFRHRGYHVEEKTSGRCPHINAIRQAGEVGPFSPKLRAETRLLCTRLALRILADPADPLEDDKKFPTEEWPQNWYRHSRVQGWQSVFKHAIRDPLFLLATELPTENVLELGERSRAWPADLRRRWTYAAAVGAFSGCVF